MARTDLAGRKWPELWRQLRALGCTARPARGSHQLIKCRCGRSSAVLPVHGRDIPDGTIHRAARTLLRCACMDVEVDP